MYKVLVADDEPYVIEGLDIMIDWKGHGFEIAGRAYSGTEALKIFEELEPDLVVADINMPGMDGLDLVEKLVKGGYKGEIIILTGYTEVEYARRAMTYGVKYFINKPVDEEEFYDALESVKTSLDKKRMLSGNIGMSEAIAAARRRSILSGEDPEHIAGGVMILHVGSDDINESIFPENVYIYDRYAGIVSLVICNTDDFERTAGELFEKVKQIKPEVTGVRRIMDGCSIAQCVEAAAKSLMCRLHVEKGRLYDAAEPGGRSISPIEIADYADRVVGRTELCDKKGAEAEAEKMFVMLEDSRDPIAYAMIFTSYLLVRINKLILKNGGTPYDPSGDTVDFNNRGTVWLDQYYRMVRNMCGIAVKEINRHKAETDGHAFNVVEKYIKEHFKEQIVIQDMARQLYTSPGYLGTMFARQVGVSIKEYLHTLRMEEAVKLMTETNMSLSEIAYDVGYNNYNNFYHHFERFFGMTPREYKDAL